MCSLRIFFAFLLLPLTSFAAPLVDEKALQEIATDSQWLALLHYDSSFPFYNKTSRADKSDLFLSPEGRVDPLKELRATLEASTTPTSEDDNSPLCRFPARFEWLRTKFSSLKEIKPPPCARLTAWYKAMNPEAVTVIFASSFLNNPASAFGHTFLRLDQPGQNEETRLLAYSADFAAATFGEDALSYAFKGIFGGYSGFYSITPYYEKITEYSELENRDIWEYQLALTPEEIKLLTLHLWELRDRPFSYYYFDENCSYHILGLLSVARPAAHLPESFRSWVLPVDTIRTLIEESGLVQATVFRPSAATKLKLKISNTPHEGLLKAYQIAKYKDRISSLSEMEPTEKAKVLDIAYDYQTYERIRIGNELQEEKDQAWSLLAERAKLPKELLKNPVERSAQRPLTGFSRSSLQKEVVEEV